MKARIRDIQLQEDHEVCSFSKIASLYFIFNSILFCPEYLSTLVSLKLWRTFIWSQDAIHGPNCSGLFNNMLYENHSCLRSSGKVWDIIHSHLYLGIKQSTPSWKKKDWSITFQLFYLLSNLSQYLTHKIAKCPAMTATLRIQFVNDEVLVSHNWLTALDWSLIDHRSADCAYISMGTLVSQAFPFSHALCSSHFCSLSFLDYELLGAGTCI